MTLPVAELKADFKTLFKFFLPIFLMTLMGNITIFIEKILFGYVSPKTLAISVDVNFIARIFQVTFVYLASLTQVYVGERYGAREHAKIGAAVWQLIWFSILSSLLTVPTGLWIGQNYFHGTSLTDAAAPYFYVYIGMNFLYPLKATLTGFYLGIGKASWVTKWTIGGECLQLLLSSIFILGIPPWIPSFGLMGGAFSNLVAQSFVCIFLLIHFLSSPSLTFFEPKKWKYQPTLFWKLIKPGLFRAIAPGVQATSWAAISYVMTQQGDPYISVLSIGVTVFYFLACLGSSLHIMMMTLNAQFLGAQAFHLIKKSLKNAQLLIAVLFIPLCLPFFFFSEPLLQLLFPRILLEPNLMHTLLKSVWMCLTTYAITGTTSGVILAFKDTRFLLLIGIWSLIFDFGICCFLAIDVFHISPSYFWVTISLGHLILASAYYWRIQKLEGELLRACKEIASQS